MNKIHIINLKFIIHKSSTLTSNIEKNATININDKTYKKIPKKNTQEKNDNSVKKNILDWTTFIGKFNKYIFNHLIC